MKHKGRKIRKRLLKNRQRGRGEYTIYQISIPEDIAKNIPDNMEFRAELTPDGLLFRPVLPVPPPPIPDWCKP